MLLPLMLVVLISSQVHAGESWGAWPEGTDPKTIGKRLAVNLVERDKYMVGNRGGLQYPEACTAYGALRFADTTKDKELLDKLIARYQMIVTDKPETSDGKTLLQK